MVEPFTIDVPEAELVDLHERLDRTRWASAVTQAWDYGTPPAYLRTLLSYWRHGYDWRVEERLLNRNPHFAVAVGGSRIHCIRVHGKGPEPLPLILTSGRPSTFFELTNVIGPLTDPAAHGGDPADSFDVVLPSLPGYGFSEVPSEPGMTPMRIAGIWVDLMQSLGYDRFCAHGSDWGAYVSALIGYAHPGAVRGLHLTMIPMRPPPEAAQRMMPGEEDHRRRTAAYRSREMGYQAIQSTKPQTLAQGLNDSPAGLAAWILEKWRAWSDCGGEVERVFTRDDLLTTVCIYWFTQTIASSVRLYYESRANPVELQAGERIDVPTAFSLFPRDGRPVWGRAERAFNVSQWVQHDRGGHFPAMERPDTLVDDLRAAFRAFR